MKIAMFTDFYFDNHPAATIVKNLRRRLEEEGNSVYILTAAESSSKQSEEGVFSFTSANIKRYPHFKLSLSPFMNAKRIIRALKVDVIHNFAMGSMGAAAATCSKDLNIPSVNTIIDALPYTYSAGHGSKMAKFVKDASLRYLKWLNSFFTATTFPSKYCKTLMKEISGDPRFSEAEVIPFPISKEDVRNTNREVGYVGMVEKHTEFAEMVKNAEAIKNKAKKELSLYCTNNGNKGPEFKHINYEERWKAYGKCAVYIDLPSYGAYNNFAIEYLSTGKPAIAPLKSPLAEELKHIDERLIYESKYISEAVQFALENAKKLKSSFDELLETYQRSHKEYLSLYKSLVK